MNHGQYYRESYGVPPSLLPGGPGTAGFLPGLPSVGTMVGTAAGYLIRNLATSSSSTASALLPGEIGPRLPPGYVDPTCPPPKRRRRRRRMLTCSDKADIAFLHGQLGSGNLGRSAISSLIASRCS